MQSNEYSSYDAYDYGSATDQPEDDPLLGVAQGQPGRSMDVNFDDPRVANLPRVLLMGPRRGGKTSIQVSANTATTTTTVLIALHCILFDSIQAFSHSYRLYYYILCLFLSFLYIIITTCFIQILQRVVFQKMSPHETLFRLEATQGLERAVVDHTPLCRFTIWDFPGDYYGEDENVFGGSTSLIFVVDAQDEPYDHVLQSFTNAVTRALELNPNIAIEVFINKVDGELFLSDESKYDCRRDIMTQVTDELTDAGVSPDSIHIRYHLTSIYDHSIYEALSRVVQRLIPQLPTLENLLNVLVSTCAMEKAYLFDVVSKLYISTDPGPVDMQSVELCSDMIDVVLDVSGIYGLGPSHLELANQASEIRSVSSGDPAATNAVADSSKEGGLEGGGPDDLVGTLISQAPAEDLEEEMVDPDSAYDSESASVIRLSNGMVRTLELQFRMGERAYMFDHRRFSPFCDCSSSLVRYCI
jgi:Ras-related GTP-binding protein C/D